VELVDCQCLASLRVLDEVKAKHVTVTVLLSFIFLYDVLTACKLCLQSNSMHNVWNVLLYYQSGFEEAR